MQKVEKRHMRTPKGRSPGPGVRDGFKGAVGWWASGVPSPLVVQPSFRWRDVGSDVSKKTGEQYPPQTEQYMERCIKCTLDLEPNCSSNLLR